MAIQMLDKIFKPRRIALIGVSPNPKSVGGKILTNLVGGGFGGVVYPINPTSEAVMGIPCFPSVKSLPKTPDLGIICAAAREVPGLVRECGEAGIVGIIIVSAGFKEAGPEGQALEDEIRALRKSFDGMRIIGPNCLGVISASQQLNASFAPAMPKKGNIAFISQSGALGASVLDWALEEKIGFSYFVSIGNTVDVDFGDLIDYFGEDEDTKSIILYIESISRARSFMTAARAFARTKPIIAYKAGRFPESARVFDFGEIFDVAELLGRHKIPKGPRLGIITNAGGPGVMASDALIAAGGVLARLSVATLAKLNDSLPAMWSHGNPVDVLGDAKSKLVAKAAQALLQDDGVDAALIIITPQAMTNATAIAREISLLATETRKPILAAWLGGGAMREGIRVLDDAGIPTYSTPEQAVRAFMTLVSYARNLEILYETPKDISVEFPVDRAEIRSKFAAVLGREAGTLAEDASKRLLEAYGIPTTVPSRAATAEEAVRLAGEIGYPVVLKVLSPDITHKSDVGGVALDLENAGMVRGAFGRMMASVAAKKPAARIEGVTVQKMVSAKDAVEMILGIKRDPTFGTVIMAGAGGTTAELFADRALGFPPLNERLARLMLESLKIRPLLEGYRGRPAANVAKLIEVLIRLSYLAADFPEIRELDINPLLVTARDTMALDARVIAGGEAGTPAHPYAHLALRPYPEKFVRKVGFKDGAEVTLRPIKPEDEPLWMDLLAGCSRETIYFRFRHFFFWQSHEVATRYCYIDYDREMAIVAETGQGDARRIIGVGRLIADPDRREAEYAILVTDAWQDQGLGGVITDFCLEIASEWGVRKITAVTTTDNPRMIAVFRKRGFEITADPDGKVVEVSRDLS